MLFDNIADKLKQELSRKRKKPQAVYFCPSCDPFQPVPEILDQTYKTMAILLEAAIGVQFLTKAIVPANFITLFAEHNNLVSGQIGLTTVDDNIRRIFEPKTANVSEKLATMKNLVEIGVTTGARVDPLIYGIMDSDRAMSDLFSAIAKTGIKEVAVNYLFLRPAVKESIKKNVTNKDLLSKLLNPYQDGVKLPIGLKNSFGISLPGEIRKKQFVRIKNIAFNFGVSIHICGCKNSDVTSETCNITRSLH
jgi:DNA repair photolyase